MYLNRYKRDQHTHTRRHNIFQMTILMHVNVHGVTDTHTYTEKTISPVSPFHIRPFPCNMSVLCEIMLCRYTNALPILCKTYCMVLLISLYPEIYIVIKSMQQTYRSPQRMNNEQHLYKHRPNWGQKEQRDTMRIE